MSDSDNDFDFFEHVEFDPGTGSKPSTVGVIDDDYDSGEDDLVSTPKHNAEKADADFAELMQTPVSRKKPKSGSPVPARKAKTKKKIVSDTIDEEEEKDDDDVGVGSSSKQKRRYRKSKSAYSIENEGRITLNDWLYLTRRAKDAKPQEVVDTFKGKELPLFVEFESSFFVAAKEDREDGQQKKKNKPADKKGKKKADLSDNDDFTRDLSDSDDDDEDGESKKKRPKQATSEEEAEAYWKEKQWWVISTKVHVACNTYAVFERIVTRFGNIRPLLNKRVKSLLGDLVDATEPVHGSDQKSSIVVHPAKRLVQRIIDQWTREDVSAEEAVGKTYHLGDDRNQVTVRCFASDYQSYDVDKIVTFRQVNNNAAVIPSTVYRFVQNDPDLEYFQMYKNNQATFNHYAVTEKYETRFPVLAELTSEGNSAYAQLIEVKGKAARNGVFLAARGHKNNYLKSLVADLKVDYLIGNSTSTDTIILRFRTGLTEDFPPISTIVDDIRVAIAKRRYTTPDQINVPANQRLTGRWKPFDQTNPTMFAAFTPSRDKAKSYELTRALPRIEDAYLDVDLVRPWRASFSVHIDGQPEREIDLFFDYLTTYNKFLQTPFVARARIVDTYMTQHADKIVKEVRVQDLQNMGLSAGSRDPQQYSVLISDVDAEPRLVAANMNVPRELLDDNIDEANVGGGALFGTQIPNDFKNVASAASVEMNRLFKQQMKKLRANDAVLIQRPIHAYTFNTFVRASTQFTLNTTTTPIVPVPRQEAELDESVSNDRDQDQELPSPILGGAIERGLTELQSQPDEQQQFANGVSVAANDQQAVMDANVNRAEDDDEDPIASLLNDDFILPWNEAPADSNAHTAGEVYPSSDLEVPGDIFTDESQLFDIAQPSMDFAINNQFTAVAPVLDALDAAPAAVQEPVSSNKRTYDDDDDDDDLIGIMNQQREDGVNEEDYDEDGNYLDSKRQRTAIAPYIKSLVLSVVSQACVKYTITSMSGAHSSVSTMVLVRHYLNTSLENVKTWAIEYVKQNHLTKNNPDGRFPYSRAPTPKDVKVSVLGYAVPVVHVDKVEKTTVPQTEAMENGFHKVAVSLLYSMKKKLRVAVFLVRVYTGKTVSLEQILPQIVACTPYAQRSVQKYHPGRHVRFLGDTLMIMPHIPKQIVGQTCQLDGMGALTTRFGTGVSVTITNETDSRPKSLTIALETNDRQSYELLFDDLIMSGLLAMLLKRIGTDKLFMHVSEPTIITVPHMIHLSGNPDKQKTHYYVVSNKLVASNKRLVSGSQLYPSVVFVDPALLQSWKHFGPKTFTAAKNMSFALTPYQLATQSVL